MSSLEDKKAAEIRRLVRHMELTTEPLELDLQFAGDSARKDPKNQFWRRCLIRCLFAYADCLLWNMKRIVPEIADLVGTTLTEDEKLGLKELRHKIENGLKVWRRNTFPFPDNLKFTSQMFAKVFLVDSPDFSDSGFEALGKTNKLRDRLMHPKTPMDPGVSDEEMAQARKGTAWVVDEMNKLFERSRSGAAKLPNSRMRITLPK